MHQLFGSCKTIKPGVGVAHPREPPAGGRHERERAAAAKAAERAAAAAAQQQQLLAAPEVVRGVGAVEACARWGGGVACVGNPV